MSNYIHARNKDGRKAKFTQQVWEGMGKNKMGWEISEIPEEVKEAQEKAKEKEVVKENALIEENKQLKAELEATKVQLNKVPGKTEKDEAQERATKDKAFKDKLDLAKGLKEKSEFNEALSLAEEAQELKPRSDVAKKLIKELEESLKGEENENIQP